MSKLANSHIWGTFYVKFAPTLPLLLTTLFKFQIIYFLPNCDRFNYRLKMAIEILAGRVTGEGLNS